MGGLGSVCLMLAAATGLVGVGVAAVCVARTPTDPERVARLLRDAEYGLVIAAGWLVAALGSLAYAFVTNDFTLSYVADHARRGVPVAYRLSGIWGGMEGSLLLWTTLLATVTAVAVHRIRRDPEADLRFVARSILVLAALVAAFSLIELVTASPFATLLIPATDGGGMVPILEHPAMVYHPPLLYLGLVTLAVPFALAIAALTMAQDVRDERWQRRVRSWCLVSWSLITIGLLAGANWAYVELGWGGYWAWDPIENGALLPWLAVTGAFHQLLLSGSRLATSGDDDHDHNSDSQIEQVRSSGLNRAAFFLVVAFALAMMGTLITRSGATQSVHAFAQDTAVGRALLALFVAVVVGSLLVSALGARRSRSKRRFDAAELDTADTADTADAADADVRPELSVHRLLTAQAAVVIVAIVVIAAGVLAPIIRSWSGGDTTAIGGEYFAQFIAPLSWLALLGIITVPMLPRPGWPLGLSVLGALVVVCITTAVGIVGWLPMFTIGLASVAFFASCAGIGPRGWRHGGGFVAHAGFAVLLIGIGGSLATQEVTRLLGPGDSVTVAGVVVRSVGAHGVEDRNNPRIVAPVVIERGATTHRLEPMIVGYPALGVRLSESGLWSTPQGDVQVILRTANDDGTALYDIRVRPVAPFVWWGGIIMLAGGLLSFGRRPPARVDG